MSVIIFGPAGCGKTKLAKELAHHFNLPKIADDWDNRKEVPADSLVLTNCTPQGSHSVLDFTLAAAMLQKSQDSVFDRVSDMNAAFGNPKGNPANIDWVRLRSQCTNIYSEYVELLTAIGAQDIDATRDALCDIQVFVQGAQHFMGVSGNADMHAVIDGVLTRFCTNQQELDATCAKYANLGVDFYIEGEFPTVCLKSSFDQGPEYPKGKFLKSVNYRQPVFPPLNSTVS